MQHSVTSDVQTLRGNHFPIRFSSVNLLSYKKKKKWEVTENLLIFLMSIEIK